MTEDQDKINIPEDFPGTGDGGVAKPDAVIDRDPDVLAEEKKARIWHIKLERYKELATAIGFFLRTFKAEAVSLVSGLGTLVVGWYQIRKWIYAGRAESKAVGKSEGQVVGRAAERAERKEDRREALATKEGSHRVETSTGSGYGSGAGRLGSGHRVVPVEVKKLRVLAQQQVQMVATPGIEIVTASAPETTKPLFDMMNSLSMGLPVIFIGSTVMAWFKRKKKTTENGGK